MSNKQELATFTKDKQVLAYENSILGRKVRYDMLLGEYVWSDNQMDNWKPNEIRELIRPNRNNIFK